MLSIDVVLNTDETLTKKLRKRYGGLQSVLLQVLTCTKSRAGWGFGSPRPQPDFTEMRGEERIKRRSGDEHA